MQQISRTNLQPHLFSLMQEITNALLCIWNRFLLRIYLPNKATISDKHLRQCWTSGEIRVCVVKGNSPKTSVAVPEIRQLRSFIRHRAR